MAQVDLIQEVSLRREVLQDLGVEVVYLGDQVNLILEVNQQPEEQGVVLTQEVKVEQVQVEPVHQEQHLKQVKVGQEDQELDVIYGLK